MGKKLREFIERYRPRMRSKTHDTSENGYNYVRGQLTMEDKRNYANIERRLKVGNEDGQQMQQFMSDSPWSGDEVFEQIQQDIGAREELQAGGVLILDESADEKAGEGSIGAGRQYNGRLGKVELSQVGVTLTYAHRGANTWAMVDGELYLPPAWFDEAHAVLRQKLGLPATRQYADHAELGLRMIDRAINRKLPFRLVACEAAQCPQSSQSSRTRRGSSLGRQLQNCLAAAHHP